MFVEYVLVYVVSEFVCVACMCVKERLKEKRERESMCVLGGFVSM